jgi:hypothetical protein
MNAFRPVYWPIERRSFSFGRELGFEQTLGPLGGGDESAPFVVHFNDLKSCFGRWQLQRNAGYRVSELYCHLSTVGAGDCIFVY